MRGRLQFRLSSLLAMILAASAMMAVNVLYPRCEKYYLGWVEWGINKSYGYPFEFCVEKEILLGEERYPVVWILPGLVLDVLVLVALTGLVGGLVEWFCRRRVRA